VAGCCECGDEPSGSCATKLFSRRIGRPRYRRFGETYFSIFRAEDKLCFFETSVSTPMYESIRRHNRKEQRYYIVLVLVTLTISYEERPIDCEGIVLC
jgi:hypothetical protein